MAGSLTGRYPAARTPKGEKEMKMKDLFKKLRQRAASKPHARAFTADWTPRDWADLPTHHPRRENDAL